MKKPIKDFFRKILPGSSYQTLVRATITLHAALVYPRNRMIRLGASRTGRSIGSEAEEMSSRNSRLFHYNHALLPNPLLAESERDAHDLESAKRLTGLTVGYPAWNLLYYALLCSAPAAGEEFVVVETGTNQGISTVVLAQALKDLGLRSVVRTVDIDPSVVEIAKHNVEKAGLSAFVDFHVEDSHRYLARLVSEVNAIHFAFLDGSHAYEDLRKEFTIIYPKVVACHGKVYFDNTTTGGVARALKFIRIAYGGNLVEFENCSWCPPGNVIWQP
jgi:predicted O-methyltransferase YrrM